MSVRIKLGEVCRNVAAIPVVLYASVNISYEMFVDACPSQPYMLVDHHIPDLVPGSCYKK